MFQLDSRFGLSTHTSPPMQLPLLNLHVYARPPVVRPGPTVEHQGVVFPSLIDGQWSQARFGIAFEQVAEQLQTIPRLYFEYDGSFLWTGEQAGTAWQLDGMLYDYGGQLQRMELKGQCPWDAWNRLLETLGQPAEELIVQLLEPPCFVEAPALARLWASQPTS